MLLPHTPTGRLTPSTSSMTLTCEEAMETPAVPSTMAPAAVAEASTMTGDGAKARRRPPMAWTAMETADGRDTFRCVLTVLLVALAWDYSS